MQALVDAPSLPLLTQEAASLRTAQTLLRHGDIRVVCFHGHEASTPFELDPALAGRGGVLVRQYLKLGAKVLSLNVQLGTRRSVTIQGARREGACAAVDSRE